MTTAFTGYAEGYYARLLTWPERGQILDTLQRLGMNTYYYAPKEDECHRLHWRTPYCAQWRQGFAAFCKHATANGVQVVAGVAPGLDFDFSDLPAGDDFRSLVDKCAQLLDDGAQAISLLMDDIDADFDKRCGRFCSEGQAHAALANALSEALRDCSSADIAPSGEQRADSLWVTPRIYADELICTAPDYLSSFVATLHRPHKILYCGSDVVAHTLDQSSRNALRLSTASRGESDELKHRVIIWDNLYANDYCPRRLFLGPWQRRNTLDDVLLNPTGMVNTDCLLLELMAVGLQADCQSHADELSITGAWWSVLEVHGVPEQFKELGAFFWHPVFNTGESSLPLNDGQAVREAIEHCLWRWKSALSREWYPVLFGLKHDLLTLADEHPLLRIHKTQNAPLATLLAAQLKSDD